MNKNINVKMTIDDTDEIFVTLYNNPTTQSFLKQLPKIFQFEDYLGKKKICFLDEKLITKKDFSHAPPISGDFTYFSSWGNLALWHKDVVTEGSVIIMGKIELGKKLLAKQKTDFKMKIEVC